MGSQTENLWQNTTGRNIENRRPLLATKTQPGNERFIENSLAGERKFQLHQIGSEADNNTKCGQSGRPELIITFINITMTFSLLHHFLSSELLLKQHFLRLISSFPFVFWLQSPKFSQRDWGRGGEGGLVVSDYEARTAESWLCAGGRRRVRELWSPPVLVTSPLTLQVEEGGEVFLPCFVSRLGSCVPTWQHGDRVVSVGHLLVRRDLRLRVTGYHGLVISR